MLYVRDETCRVDHCQAGIDGAGPGGVETLVFHAEAERRYFIIVDGTGRSFYPSETGRYSLEVR